MATITVLVNGVLGEMDDALLKKRTGGFDNENETTSWVEYWLHDVLVHRSAHVTLKRPVTLDSEVGGF